MTEGKAGRPTRYKNSNDLQAAIDAYLSACRPAPLMHEVDGEMQTVTDSKGFPVIIQNPPTISGLSYALGFATRQSIYDLEKRGASFSYVIKRARLFIEAHHESNLSTRDKPVGDIFWLKNHDWKDKAEVEHSGTVEPVRVIIGAYVKPEAPGA